MHRNLAEVNAQLDRARREYREAMTAEQEAKQLRKPIQSAKDRVRVAAAKYDQALDAFIEFHVKKRNA
jgi:polyhydroxyalkanoate synthesis regulator protein